MDQVGLIALGLLVEGLHPGDHSRRLLFQGSQQFQPPRLAPLENHTRSISRTAFSLAGVPAGRAHFKDVKNRETASGIYLWLLVCTFGGRGAEELPYTARSYPGIGRVYMKTKQNKTLVWKNYPQGHLGWVIGWSVKKELGGYTQTPSDKVPCWCPLWSLGKGLPLYV